MIPYFVASFALNPTLHPREVKGSVTIAQRSKPTFYPMGQKKKHRFTRPTIAEMYEFVRFLGPLASEYTDAELRQLYTEMHQMANLLLDIYRWRQKLDLHSEEP
jgi:hypothetical protein